jgi:hypothetical protein
VLRKVLLIAVAAMFMLPAVAMAAHAGDPLPYPTTGFLGDDTNQCFFSTDGEHPTSDFGAFGGAYPERNAGFNTTLRDIGLACVGTSAVKVTGHTEGAARQCDENAPLRSAFEDATFADGEEVAVCDLPAVRILRDGTARNRGASFAFVAQGFACSVTVNNPEGGPTEQIDTNDSIEFDDRYVDLNGNAEAAITTACVGRLHGTSAASDSNFACEENNPFGPGTVAGIGTTYVFGDNQFEQICQIAKHRAPKM